MIKSWGDDNQDLRLNFIFIALSFVVVFKHTQKPLFHRKTIAVKKKKIVKPIFLVKYQNKYTKVKSSFSPEIWWKQYKGLSFKMGKKMNLRKKKSCKILTNWSQFIIVAILLRIFYFICQKILKWDRFFIQIYIMKILNLLSR